MKRVSLSSALMTLPFALSLPTNTLAQQTGSELLSDCEQILEGMVVKGEYVQLRESLEGNRCWGYMSAVQNLSRFSEDGKSGVLHTCIPPESRLAQLIRIVVNYGQQHPEELHKDWGVD